MSAYLKTFLVLSVVYLSMIAIAALLNVPKEESIGNARFFTLVTGICMIVQRQSKK